MLGGAADNDEISFATLVRDAVAHKWTIVSVAFLFLALSGLYIYSATPLYTATSSLVLKNQEQNLFDFESVAPELASSDLEAMNTEILVLTSRSLLGRVVDAMSLVEDAEFNPSLRPKPAWKEAIGYNAARDYIKSLLGLVSEEGPQEYDPREDAIEILRYKLDVTIVPKTYAIDIAVVAQDPGKAARISDKIADLYITEQLHNKFTAMDDAMVWLSARVADLKEELETAESQVRQYAAQSTVITEETLIVQTEKLKRLRDELSTSEEVAAELRSRVERLETLRAESDFATLSDFAVDPQLRAVSRALANQPDDSALLSRFETVFERRMQALAGDVGRAERKVASLRRGVTDLEEELRVRSSDFVRLQQLQREAEATRLIYEHSLARMKEISIQQGIQQADARVLDPAKIPDGPSHPKTLVTLAGGGLLGSLLGFVFVFMRNSLRTTLESPEETEAVTGVRVIGTIPQMRARRPSALLRKIVDEPASPIAESIRNLRTTIQLSNLDAPPQVIMLTSSVPGEGKSTVSAGLAQASATSGKRVLLVDADLRRRTLKEYFEIDKKVGLLSVLSGKTSFDEAVHHDEASQIDIIIADEGKVTAGDIFGSHRFESFLAQMRQSYDVIIIDTPPILAVSDTRAIARNADAIIYVVKWNSTEQRVLRAGLNTLWQVNAEVSGLVLNQIKASGADRYGYYGYSYN